MATIQSQSEMSLDEQLYAAADAAKKAYLEVVFETVESGNVTPDKVRAVLTETGKSIADFKADVEAYRKRYVAAAIVAGEAKVEQQMSDLHRQIMGLERKREQRRQELEKVAEVELGAITDEILDLNRAQRRVQEERVDVMSARQFLIDSSPALAGTDAERFNWKNLDPSRKVPHRGPSLWLDRIQFGDDAPNQTEIFRAVF